MNTKIMMDFLAELCKNNDREWYHAHKKQREEAQFIFQTLLSRIIDGIGEFDPSVANKRPGDLTFKLVRDTRFSHDKSPYNPAFRAHISSKGKLPIPVGYYIMLKPNGGSFLGGGLFADIFTNATAMVRDCIATHGDEFADIIGSPEFKKYFTVKGAALKNVPSGYDKSHPQAEFLKYKSWYTEYLIPDAVAENGERLVETAVNVFRAVKPFNDYLNTALKDFKMPTR